MGVPKGWVRADRRHRCPVCDRADWCMVSVDGTKAACCRMKDGASGYRHKWEAWIHNVGGPVVVAPSLPKRHDPPAIDAAFLAERYREAGEDRIAQIADELGVSAWSLRSLGCGWAREHRAATFPMRDGERNIIGIRLRRSDGRKWAVAGSRSGVFVPDGFPGALDPEREPVFIVEGPSDAAALIDLGFDVIGRPSCRGGVDYIKDLCYRHARRRTVAVVADHDGPGVEGAEQLAASLRPIVRSLKVIEPTRGKDARAWKAEGVTRDRVRMVVDQAFEWS